MSTFSVAYTETSRHSLEIEAASAEDAKRLANDQLKDLIANRIMQNAPLFGQLAVVSVDELTEDFPF